MCTLAPRAVIRRSDIVIIIFLVVYVRVLLFDLYNSDNIMMMFRFPDTVSGSLFFRIFLFFFLLFRIHALLNSQDVYGPGILN